ncbi:cupin domain-containing protein [Azospirillum sp. A23]|uniref:cupin domain-containing protein n=1 Tax=Azospirillum sp. A23 TaxID=3160608 RepID=UPI0026BFB6F6
MTDDAPTAERLIDLLGLQPHPEGGFYAETYRAPGDGGRGAVTAIYFLLKAGQRSHWHTVDAVVISDAAF